MREQFMGQLLGAVICLGIAYTLLRNLRRGR